MKGLIIQREILNDRLISEIMPYARAHFTEAVPFDWLKVSVNTDEYKSLEEAGALRVFTARNGKLVGYAVMIVHCHPHYDVLSASQALLYLSPDERKGWVGASFLRSIDSILRNEGVQIVYQFSSDKKNIGSLLKRSGYERIEEVWARRLN